VSSGEIKVENIPVSVVYFGDPDWNEEMGNVSNPLVNLTVGDLVKSPLSIFSVKGVGTGQYQSLAKQLSDDFGDINLPDFDYHSFPNLQAKVGNS